MCSEIEDKTQDCGKCEEAERFRVAEEDRAKREAEHDAQRRAAGDI